MSNIQCTGGGHMRIFYYGIRKTGKNDYNVAYVLLPVLE